jgi:hypothetical protein
LPWHKNKSKIFNNNNKKSRRQVGKREATFQMAQTNEIKEKKLKINFRIGGGGEKTGERADPVLPPEMIIVTESRAVERPLC